MRARSTHAPIAAAMCLFASAAHSQPDPFDGSQHVNVSVSTHSTDPIHVGQTRYLVLTLDHAKDWHTYYPGLNDTGYGTTVTIDPVEGIEFGDQVFETPERYLAPGNILDHVYHDTAHIYIPFTISKPAAAQTHTVSLAIDYLVCKEMCLPGSESLTTTISVEEIHPYSRVHTPPKLPSPLPEGVLTIEDDTVTFSAPGATSYTFIPHTNSAEFVNLLNDGHQDASAMTLTLKDPSAADPITGRLRITYLGGTTLDYDVEHHRETSVTSLTTTPSSQGATP